MAKRKLRYDEIYAILPDGTIVKPCGKCKQRKVEAQFGKCDWKHRASWCTACRYMYNREWCKNNPDRLRAQYEKHVLYNRSLKAAAFAVLGENCSCCQESRVAFLQIDHIANDGAAHRRILSGKRGRNNSAMDKLYKEIIAGHTAGLQTLCANCNWGKARNDGVCPHVDERAAERMLAA